MKPRKSDPKEYYTLLNNDLYRALKAGDADEACHISKQLIDLRTDIDFTLKDIYRANAPQWVRNCLGNKPLDKDGMNHVMLLDQPALLRFYKDNNPNDWEVGSPVLNQALCAAARNDAQHSAAYLIEQGADPNTNSGEPVMTALFMRNIKMLNLLEQGGADIKRKNSHYLSVTLSLMSPPDDPFLIEWLLDKKAEVCAGAVMQAGVCLGTDLFKEIVDRALGNGIDRESMQYTALTTIPESGRLSELEYIQKNMLHMVRLKKMRPETLAVLCNYHAETLTTRDFQTFWFLLKQEQRLDPQPPFEQAVRKGHLATARFLVLQGADPTLNECAMLKKVRQQEKTDDPMADAMLHSFRSQKIKQLELAYTGKNAQEVVNDDGETSLHLAAAGKLTKLVQTMMQQDPSLRDCLYQPDKNGNTPLSRLIDQDHIEAIMSHDLWRGHHKEFLHLWHQLPDQHKNKPAVLSVKTQLSRKALRAPLRKNRPPQRGRG